MDDRQTQAPAGVDDGAVRQLAADPASRKRFLKMVGGTGAAGAFALFLAACGGEGETTTAGPQRPSGAGAGDVDVLNYALTLEYLETDFYNQVVESGEIKDQEIAELARQFGEQEQEHVDALTATVEQLGGTPAEIPETDFEDVLRGGAKRILETAAMVENLGAAAYLGAAPEIESPEVLAAALSIHTVEARHAAALNEAAGNSFSSGDELVGSIPDGAFAEPMTMDEVMKAVEPYLARNSGR